MSAAFGTHENSLRLALVLAAVLGSGGRLALAQSNAPPCPDSVLAPSGLAPDSHCKGTGCLVEFKGYKWWTAFTFNKQEGYYNGGLGTIFAPEHVSIGPNGNMVLNMAKDWNRNTQWAGAEAVLMFKNDGTQANLGYGDYLVTAELVSPPLANWADYDQNVAFGLFTFERPATGSVNDNPAREVDLAEISRWGWNHRVPQTCPFTGFQGKFDTSNLCVGNAQFALQDYTKHSGMVKRYNIEPINEVTLVMRWRAGQVTFEQYHAAGLLNNLSAAGLLNNLPATVLNKLPASASGLLNNLPAAGLTLNNLPAPDSQWTTPIAPPADNLSAFVPAPNCQRFHINLWLGSYIGKPRFAPHDGPTNGENVEVLIKNFEFIPK